MSGALEGVRVVDFGQYIAGPMAAMLLADHGADVIRIDPPGGPRWDTPGNATWNRNKRSIILDLKSTGGLAEARRLIASADVLVENFRPGVMKRLGLGSDTLLTEHPSLIYCSLPGFASNDPRASVAAWEGVLSAATACYRQRPRPGHPVTPISRPNYTPLPVPSLYGAYWGAVSIVAALNARQRDGLGQHIEVPLFDATFGAIGNVGMNVTAGPGQQPLPIRVWTAQFQCKDGRGFQYHAANKRFHAFLNATGASAWTDDEMTEEEYRQRAQELFLTRTAQEWEDFCESIGTEGGVIRTAAEWIETPQARGSQIIVDFEDPLLGKMSGPGINVRLSETPGTIRSPRHMTGADNGATFGDVTSHPTPASKPLLSALEGVRVLDLSIILAGPTCGRTLAEFGADVIKIDSPHVGWVNGHINVNNGKRTLLIDLKTAEGLDIFWKLVDQADVIVQNFRQGVAQSLGISYEQVRARKPDIIYASLNMYGQIGPWAGRPGHEQIAQAISGIAERGGAPYPIHDYATGFMGAYGIALALLHRRRTGKGQHIDTALAYTATMNQSSLIQTYEGKQWDEARGTGVLGTGPLYRAYQATDGWLFLAGRLEQLARAEGISGIESIPAEQLEAEIERRIATADVDTWVARLTAAGVGATRVIHSLDGLMEDPWVVANGLSMTRPHEGMGMIRTPGPAPRLSRTPVRVGYPSHPPGSDAASILAEIGMAGELSRLVDAGVIAVEGVAAGY